jgi:predicted DNA-binding protein (MmcQ/YjbR family)
MSDHPFRRNPHEPDQGRLAHRLDHVREYCLDKPHVTEEFPFGPEVMVFKLAGRIYALISWEKDPLWLSLKCDPDRALLLRGDHESIIPGYHLNKKLWNTLILDDTLDDDLVHDLVDHSYDLIFASLKKSVRDALE